MSGQKQNPGAYCPSCERFIGPVDVCPYCDCDSARSPVFRIFRYGSLILAIAGLAILYFMAVRRDLSVVRISEITPMMNFGFVRVVVTVEKGGYSGKRRGGEVGAVSFNARDETGRIRVVAYGAVARELESRGLIPERGSKVEVTGSLNYSADGGTKLILRSAGDLRVRNEENVQ